MSSIAGNERVNQLIEARLEVNKWTSDSLAQYIRFQIDGPLESGFDDDGVSKKIYEANTALKNVFAEMAADITSDDIQGHLDKVSENDQDWLAHLDVAFAMAQANPKAVTNTQIEQIAVVATEPATVKSVISNAVNLRPIRAAKFIESFGLKAA